MIPFGTEPDDSHRQQAIALLRAGLGKAELEMAASYTVPFLWTLRGKLNETIVTGGSAFFVNTGEKVFAVTASHVVEKCLADSKSQAFSGCTLGSEHGNPVSFHLGDRLIDAHAKIDIATFRVSPEEIQKTGRTVLEGYSYPNWPPPLPMKDRGVIFCGFPRVGRRWSSKAKISLGRIALSGVASSSHEYAISIQIERENLFRVLGDEPLSEYYDFGGISGGPVIAIVEKNNIRSWMPAGVIIEGPNSGGNQNESISGFEIIKARPMHFILPNGELDLKRWEQTQ